MGVLYVVATPIGNLEDISGRALRILGEVDLIACEDTRQTRKLLGRYGIRTALVPYHAHNQQRAGERILAVLSSGGRVALVSDGGTPGVSDPGAALVRLAREQAVRVVPVPGPSALAAILSVSGEGLSGVTFGGFLSPRRGRRRRRLGELLAGGEAVVLFESPHRIMVLLQDLKELAPRRGVLIGREMTKVHEEFLEGFPDRLLTELAQRTKIVGEFSVFVRPSAKRFKLNPAGDDTGNERTARGDDDG